MEREFQSRARTSTLRAFPFRIAATTIMLMVFLAALLLAAVADGRSEALELLRLGRQREAADQMTTLLVESPQDRDLRAELVRVEMRIGRFASALAHCESLSEEFDSTRGMALYLLGHYEKALEFLKSDESESILFRHESLWVLARFEEAAVALEQAAKLLGENHLEVRTRRGQALARESEFQAAVDEFRFVLERDPLSAPARFGLGRALIEVGEADQGLEELLRHRTLTPLLDKLDFARRNLELDLSHAPNHAALGDALRPLLAFDSSVAVEAEGLYETASERAKPAEVVPIALRFARFYEDDLERPEEAVKVLAAALTRQDSVRLAVRAGDVLLRANDPGQALKFFERAKKLRPQDEAIDKRIEGARGAVDQGASGR